MSSIATVAELVQKESGIVLGESQYPALKTALNRAFPTLSVVEFLARAADPVYGSAAIERLLDEVTVKETFFFRDRAQLEGIDWHALHKRALNAGRSTVRVWSAACSTGEEPYSLALLAAEAFGPASPPVDILATDISHVAIAAAEAGEYRGRSLAQLSEEHLTKYFKKGLETRPRDCLYSVDDFLRQFVRFDIYNLISHPTPPLGEDRFDLILCRNVLIYFDDQTVEEVINRLEQALAPGGALILGAADAICGTPRRLVHATLAVGHSQNNLGIATKLGGSSTAGKSNQRSEAGSTRVFRRPLRRIAAPSFEDKLATAVRAADEGKTELALESSKELVAQDSLNPDLQYLRGVIELEAEDAPGAVQSLRRALYLDPNFGLAAFTLGRAHEAAGDTSAAVRAYKQALRVLPCSEERHEHMLAQVDADDLVQACFARLGALDEPIAVTPVADDRR